MEQIHSYATRVGFSPELEASGVSAKGPQSLSVKILGRKVNLNMFQGRMKSQK